MAPKKADKGKGGGEEEREEPLQACAPQKLSTMSLTFKLG
jgi:hypothetical protein